MNSFSEYMDGIRAEPELKEKTKAFVCAALAGETAADPLRKPEAAKPVRKKFRLAVSLAAACLMLTIGGYACYATPVSYVCVDINPSVELGVNLFGRVVSAQAYNEDGARLLEQGGYTHTSVEASVRALVEEAAAQGYLADDGSSVIAVTAESRSEKTAVKLQSAGETGAGLALQAAEQSAVVYADCSDLQLRTQAKEAGVSPGKYRLIQMLQALDPDIDVGQYQNAKITDIIAAADALMARAGTGWQNGSYAAALERVHTAAQAVRKAGEAARQGQNGTGGQNQAQNPGAGQQNQNQNQEGNGTAQQQPQQSHGADAAAQPAWKQETVGGTPQGQNQNESVPEQSQSPGASGTGTEHAQPQESDASQAAGPADAGPENGGSDGTGQSGGAAASGSEDAESASGGSGASSGGQPGNGAGGK